jgi:hypothetical protein
MGDWASSSVIMSIVVACTIYYTIKAWFTHRERMAKIEKGIDPASHLHRSSDAGQQPRGEKESA